MMPKFRALYTVETRHEVEFEAPDEESAFDAFGDLATDWDNGMLMITNEVNKVIWEL